MLPVMGLRAVGIAALAFVGALAIALAYAALTSASAGAERVFSIGTAVLVAGYLLWPAFVLLAGGLLAIAVLVALGSAMERRR